MADRPGIELDGFVITPKRVVAALPEFLLAAVSRFMPLVAALDSSKLSSYGADLRCRLVPAHYQPRARRIVIRSYSPPPSMTASIYFHCRNLRRINLPSRRSSQKSRTLLISRPSALGNGRGVTRPWPPRVELDGFAVGAKLCRRGTLAASHPSPSKPSDEFHWSTVQSVGNVLRCGRQLPRSPCAYRTRVAVGSIVGGTSRRWQIVAVDGAYNPSDKLNPGPNEEAQPEHAYMSRLNFLQDEAVLDGYVLSTTRESAAAVRQQGGYPRYRPAGWQAAEAGQRRGRFGRLFDEQLLIDGRHEPGNTLPVGGDVDCLSCAHHTKVRAEPSLQLRSADLYHVLILTTR